MSSQLLGYNISCRGLSGNIEWAFDAILSRNTSHQFIACANPHSLVTSLNDPLFAAALRNADLLLPDGAGIVLAAKILGLPITERVAGMEFFLSLSKYGQQHDGLRYFFLGSTTTVLDLIVNRLARDYPKIDVCGVYSPPFKEQFSEEDNALMVHAINAARPDILWVGMTAPKQEKWIYENRDKLNVPLIGAIGAVFDFYAGTRKRAPQWVCNLGLEWLPRLIREPKRLWQRNFVSTPLFLWLVLKAKYQKN